MMEKMIFGRYIPVDLYASHGPRANFLSFFLFLLFFLLIMSFTYGLLVLFTIVLLCFKNAISIFT